MRSEANYKDFAKQVSGILYEGATPYNVPSFYKELFAPLADQKHKTEHVRKVLDEITRIYNNKVQEDKKREGGGNKKGKQKPKIAAGKAEDTSRNNNPQMVANLMGSDDEYGDYGDYGEEVGANQRRVAEEDYDFM